MNSAIYAALVLFAVANFAFLLPYPEGWLDAASAFTLGVIAACILSPVVSR